MRVNSNRSNSIEKLPISNHENPEVLDLRERSKNASAVATHAACGVTQIIVGASLAGSGPGAVAVVPVGIALKGTEEITVVASQALTDSGFIDEGLQKTQIQANRCIIL